MSLKNRNYTIRFTEEQYDELCEMAKKEKKKLSELIRDKCFAIQTQYIQQKPIDIKRLKPPPSKKFPPLSKGAEQREVIKELKEFDITTLKKVSDDELSDSKKKWINRKENLMGVVLN